MFRFEYLNKGDFKAYAQEIFDILADNMTVIAPTGNSREDDFNMWSGAVSGSLSKEQRQMILIKDNQKLAGFFQYYTTDDTFMMEEIQFKPEYQGKGIFRELYGFVLKNINKELKFIEAYASINNHKSIGILEKFGLSSQGLNKNGRSYHFKGDFHGLLEWYESENLVR